MTQPGLQQWRLLGQAVVLACREAARAAVEAQGLREVSAMDIFLAAGTMARAGHPLSCGRLPVAIGNEVCLVSPEQWSLYQSEFREIQGAA